MTDRPGPQLELVERRPSKPVLQTPVLLVHGAYAGAWCWEEYFLPYFADQGVHAYALSLRGHGRSEGRQQLPMTALADYVEDIEQVVARLPQPPVLVGHSMGGMVVQKYLERHDDVPGVVLMASVPPQGLCLPALQLMLNDPWLFWQVSLMQYTSPSHTGFESDRPLVFSDAISDADRQRFRRRFGPESARAMWDMTVSDLVCPWRIKKPPMLVLGGGGDVLFTEKMVRSTASAYGVQAEIFPNMAHLMMLEPGWQQVADRIIDWLTALEGGKSQPRRAAGTRRRAKK